MEEKYTFKSLRELRISKKYSQLQLSKLSGVSREHINRVEQGHLHLSGFTAPRLALVFKVNYKSLIVSQELANQGLSESDRERAITIALKEAEDLESTTVDVIKEMGKANDFGDRDSFGRKLDKEQVEARDDTDLSIERDLLGRKRTKKEIKALRKEAKKSRETKDDFGDRDQFGFKMSKKQIAEKSRITDKRIDDLDDTDNLAEKKKKELLKAGRKDRIKELLKSLKDDENLVDEETLVSKIGQLIDEERNIAKRG